MHVYHILICMNVFRLWEINRTSKQTSNIFINKYYCSRNWRHNYHCKWRPHTSSVPYIISASQQLLNQHTMVKERPILFTLTSLNHVSSHNMYLPYERNCEVAPTKIFAPPSNDVSTSFAMFGCHSLGGVTEMQCMRPLSHWHSYAKQ